jgi:hypothetical protein
MTDRELLQQALDMLDDINQCSLPPTGIPLPAEIDHVMEALRARLAQPEPVIYARKEGDLIVVDLPQVPTGGGGISKDEQPEPEPEKSQDKPCVEDDGCPTEKAVLQRFWREHQAQPEQEPVAWGIANTRPTEKQPLMMVMLDKPEPSHLVVALYTAPPQREWVGLTDEEIEEIYTNAMSDFDFIFDTQAKLKEKNSTSDKNIQTSDKND